MKNQKLKMIDLFSGAGGLSYGFFKSGYKPVETLEFWQPAIDTYNFNFNTNKKISDITDKNLRENIKRKWFNKIDLIIGGFPCQGYSLAGKRDKNDPRNQLYKFVIDIIGGVKPKYFVLENVKGILSFKEKDGNLVVDIIKSMLLKFNYYLEYVLVDSSLFGVPQKRERVIFVGSNISNKEKVSKIINIIKNHKEPIISVKDSINDLLKFKHLEIPNHNITFHSENFISKIKNTKEGESVNKKYSDAYRKVYYDRPSPTVKENHGGVHIHPILNRAMTPRELARLQTFPDNFVFLGSKSQVLKQIGNAVPVKLSVEIAKIVKGVFEDEK